MRIARIFYPVKVLGPGERIGIWVNGCLRKCDGCANPELWELDHSLAISLENLCEMIESIFQFYKGHVDGVTISGGEPFMQMEELMGLINYLKTKTEDILLYTGYQRSELIKDTLGQKIIENIAVLVDGPYQKEKNNGEVLRGSLNQTIYYRDELIKKRYEEYVRMNEGKNMVQNFRIKDGIVAVGIHRDNFREELKRELQKKEIIEEGN